MKIALIEIGGSHDECLYSQILFLQDRENSHLTLVCNESLRKNVKYFDGPDEIKFISMGNGRFFQWYELFKLWRFLRSEKFDHLIFNTAQGGELKKLMLFPLGRDVRLSGILHNIGKLRRSAGQALISRKMDNYWVLNNYLLKNLREAFVEKFKVGVFYPIFFPEYPDLNLKKGNREIWICIPGQVENKRRDYKGLLDSLKNKELRKDVKFLLLGRSAHEHGDGDQVKKSIKEMGLEEQFVLWDHFIDPVEFYNHIKYSDYIMPLIHPQHESFDLYSEQISGAFNLGFGFQIPFLMEHSFHSYPDFSENAVFYEINSLSKVVNSLCKPDDSEYYLSERWSFEYQKQQYLRQLYLSS